MDAPTEYERSQMIGKTREYLEWLEARIEELENMIWELDDADAIGYERLSAQDILELVAMIEKLK